MHIGVLTHNYPRFQGDFSGTFIEALCQELARQGETVTVWAPYDPAFALPGPAPAHSSTGVTLRLYRYAPTDNLHTLGYMRSMQSDLVLRSSGYLLGPAMLAAGAAKIVRDARRHPPDILHAHWLLPNGFSGALASRLLGIPLVISVPGSDAQVANANPIFRTMARFAMRQAGLMTANSADLRDGVGALDPAILAKFDLIIYGTDPNALRPDATGVDALRTELGLTTDTFAVLCVGRMVYKKGFDTLIHALATPTLQARNVVGLMIGTGDQQAAWQQLAQEMGVADRLRWIGNVPKDKISRYYNACNVLVNPAVRKPIDGLNVCVLDAMSCGKPVVGSMVAGNPLAIVDGECGYLVPEADPPALATALARLADRRDLQQQMGQAARRRIEQELGWPPLARRYIDHFTRLIAQR